MTVAAGSPSPTAPARGQVASVTVVEAAAAQRPVLDRLLQLYKYDFSEFAPVGSPYGEVDEEGGFAYPGLESYWRDTGHIAGLGSARARPCRSFAATPAAGRWGWPGTIRPPWHSGARSPRRRRPARSRRSPATGSGGPARCCASPQAQQFRRREPPAQDVLRVRTPLRGFREGRQHVGTDTDLPRFSE